MIKENFHKSSTIAESCYDTDTQELTITFNNGTKYTYHDVSDKLYEEFIMAPSIGRYFCDYIKHNHNFSR
jgi:hypothetical protein